MNDIDVLEARVAYLEVLCESLLRVLWEERGVYKGISGRMEKELDPFWSRYLEERQK